MKFKEIIGCGKCPFNSDGNVLNGWCNLGPDKDKYFEVNPTEDENEVFYAGVGIQYPHEIDTDGFPIWCALRALV